MQSSSGSDDLARAVLDVGSALVSSLAFEEALATVVQQIGETMGVASVGMWRFSPARRVAVFEAFWSRDNALAQIGDHIGRTIALDARPEVALLLESREVVEHHIDDPGLPEKTRTMLEKQGIKTMLEAPLMVGDEVLGSLSLAETREARRFPAGERELLGQLCKLAAIGIHNAELYRRQEEHHRRALSLLESSRAMAVAADTQQTVESMRAQIATLLSGIEVDVDLHVDRGDGEFVRFLPETSGDELSANVETPDGLAERALEEVRAVQGRTEDDSRMRLVVPLILKDGVSGYVELAGNLPRRFTDDEIEFVQTLANHTAVAVEKARLQRTIARQSGIDVATGLYNRSYFHDRLFAEIARAYRYREQVTLIMLTVDGLDDYTDEHGDSQRRDVMRALGRFLKRNLRRRIDVACRWSEEEFALLLPNTGLSDGGTAKATDRLRRAIERYAFKNEDDEPLGHITVCMGVACYPNHADDAMDMTEAAEKALGRAHEAGANQVALARG